MCMMLHHIIYIAYIIYVYIYIYIYIYVYKARTRTTEPGAATTSGPRKDFDSSVEISSITFCKRLPFGDHPLELERCRED